MLLLSIMNDINVVLSNNLYKKYIANKNNYTNVNLKNQIGGHKNKFQDNIFLNKEYFGLHYSIDYREKRLHDFSQIIAALKNHLAPGTKIEIDKKLLKKYIKLYKKENRDLIDTIIKNLQYISFEEFKKQLHAQITRFNLYCEENRISKYIFVFGVGSNNGYSPNDFDLFKSNLWVFLLAYNHLKVKPYDIVLNLNIAIRLYLPNINDFLIVDDCSYSGLQLVDSILKNAIPELLYNYENAYVVISEQQIMYDPVLDKKCNIHLLIPYMSTVALKKINDFEITCGFCIIKYISKIVKTYGDILDESRLKKINEMYKNFYAPFFGELVPIFFQHKIADFVSTIDLILIKGQVLDDPTKKFVFIKECIYDKNNPDKKDYDPKQEYFIQKKIYCPIPPYLEFKKYLM